MSKRNTKVDDWSTMYKTSCQPSCIQDPPSRRALSRCPHAYLTQLLSDECQSTVGPQGWVPQHSVLTSGTDRERGERVLATCLALATYKGEWSSNVIGRLSFAMSALATRSSIS